MILESGGKARREGMLRLTMSKGAAMRGVQFLVDADGQKTAVLIDLKKNSQLWEDFYDVAIAKSRATEPRESLESVRRRLRPRSRRR